MELTTLVLGASENPERYSNRAICSLRNHGYPVIAIGKRPGRVGDVEIVTGQPWPLAIDTVTLYLSPAHQRPLYDYIIKINPRRIIFNPGTENPELDQLARQSGIFTLEACTLVMLATGQY